MTSASATGQRAQKPPDPPKLSRRARILLPILLVALVVASVHRYGIERERAITEVSGRALGTTWTVKLAGGLDLPAQRELVVPSARPEISVMARSRSMP